MIYGYLRTSRTAVDGLAGMHPEIQLQAMVDAGVESVSRTAAKHTTVAEKSVTLN